MIKYNIICDASHEFEGWFRSSDAFDQQATDGLLECPICGSQNVRKAIMAPAIARSTGAPSAGSKRLGEMREAMMDAVQRARSYVEKNYDYVGDKFPEEARRIHYGESTERLIYGEATGKDAKELVDEGIAVAPLPGASADRAGPALPKDTVAPKALPEPAGPSISGSNVKKKLN